MKSHSTTENLALEHWVWIAEEVSLAEAMPTPGNPKAGIDLLRPLRQWLDQLNVRDRQLAHRICRLIPTQCPFERDIKLFGRTILHIPPLCKLNPLYEEVVGLRFRALCYLADECGEDVSQYC